MNKSQLVGKIAKDVGVSKTEAERVLDAVTEVLSAELKKTGKVEIAGFGRFSFAPRARVARNRASLARRFAKFTPSGTLKSTLSEKR